MFCVNAPFVYSAAHSDEHIPCRIPSSADRGGSSSGCDATAPPVMAMDGCRGNASFRTKRGPSHESGLAHIHHDGGNGKRGDIASLQQSRAADVTSTRDDGRLFG
ncbi:unnamed protein product [Lampetra fluviatilis]